MRAIFRAGMRAEAADVDDRASAGFAQSRQAGLHAMEGAVERHVHHLSPLGVTHGRDVFFAPERSVVDKYIDAAKLPERCLGHRLHGLGVGDVGE